MWREKAYAVAITPPKSLWAVASPYNFATHSNVDAPHTTPPVDTVRLRAVITGVLASRNRIDYLTVARAMVHDAHLKSAEDSRDLAEALQISRQSRHNWIQPESLAEWVKLWEERLEAAKPGGAPPTVVRRRISEDDWSWITGVVNTYGGRSWEKRRQAVEREATKDSSKAHLRGIARTTLFRNRKLLTGHAERLRSLNAANAAAQAAEPPMPTTQPPKPTPPVSEAW